MLNEEQLERYEHYRRSSIHKDSIKQVIQNFFSETAAHDAGGEDTGAKAKVDDAMIIMLQGLAKVYVGSLVETARQLMTSRGEEGSILPHHLREAATRVRLAEMNGAITTGVPEFSTLSAPTASSRSITQEALPMTRLQSEHGPTPSRPATGLMSGVPQFTPGDDSIL